jgi:DNA-binding transcriptional ArsR family regulator
MLVLHLGRSDLAKVRFALSPLMEVFGSVRALESPDSRAMHAPWILAHRHEIDGEQLRLLSALQPAHCYTPDFIHPPPSSPLRCIEDELAELLCTPADRVRSEITAAYQHRALPEVLEPLIRDPDQGLESLAAVIRDYWDVMIAPHWTRMRSVLEGDVLYRARQMAQGGLEHLLADIHPEMRFAEGAIAIAKRVEARYDLAGRGLLCVPSAFVWPALGALVAAPWQPTLIYPARGTATLWEPGEFCSPAALEELIGARRAGVLVDLDAPRSTTELAERLSLSAPSVSQHLAVLRRAGLVQSSRAGRFVLYSRTQRGEGLLGAPADSAAA